MPVRRAYLWTSRLLRLSAITTLIVSLALLARTPVGAYYTDRTLPELRLAIDRLLGAEFGAAWANETVGGALTQEPVDWVLIESALEIVTARELSLSPDVAAALDAARARDKGLLGQSLNCAACAAGQANCRLDDGLICALAIEVTPVGDVRALYTEGQAWARGEPVDRINLSLAGVGLGATLAILATAGSSAGVKAGVALLRVARRGNRLSPGLQARLARIGGDLVDVSKLPRGPRALIDPAAYRAAIRPAALAEGTALVGDLGRIGTAVPAAHALALLPLVDTGGDARRIANLSEAAGARTVAITARIGKSRALRITGRLSRTGRTLASLAAALALFVVAIIASHAQRALASALRRAAHRR